MPAGFIAAILQVTFAMPNEEDRFAGDTCVFFPCGLVLPHSVRWRTAATDYLGAGGAETME